MTNKLRIYDLAVSLAGVIGYKPYCINYNVLCIYGIGIGRVSISIKYGQIIVDGYILENMEQTLSEFMCCLQEYGAQLEKIRACIAAALPQPIAEEVLEQFTILPALARFILQANKYKFVRSYSDPHICPHTLDDPFCECAE